MNYKDPREVNSPKVSISDLRVVWDGGEETEDNAWSGWALATMKWDGRRAVGVRWNGLLPSVGAPQSRGIPTWFILPGPLEKIAVKEISDQTMEKAAHLKDSANSSKSEADLGTQIITLQNEMEQLRLDNRMFRDEIKKLFKQK